jgi:hypothetical protein
MSKINLIVLIAIFAYCAALPKPSDEVVNEAPVEVPENKDEVVADDSARIHSENKKFFSAFFQIK